MLYFTGKSMITPPGAPPWLDRSEYPFQSRYFPVNGQSMHYIDEGEGETILFVHGTPSWSFDFRNVIKRLSAHYRCIAVDHIGFGLSDKPAKYDYTTPNHSRTLEKFITGKQLRHFHLVVHDFGGPIGLDVAIRRPHLVGKIIVLNSWLWSSRQEPEFVRLSRLLKSPLLPFLYRYLNFSPRVLLPGSFGDYKLSRRIRAHYTNPFGAPARRNGTLAFARSLLHDQDWFGERWQKREAISSKPTLLIWGMKDRILSPRYLDKFREGFPGARVKKLAGSGHFPQEEQPGQVAEWIDQFLGESLVDC
jgi:haloalkane dehalogenase